MLFVDAAERGLPDFAVQRLQNGTDPLADVGRTHRLADRAVEQVQELLQTRLIHHVHLSKKKNRRDDMLFGYL